jgi:diguanylate cyclase (GGDEF)-like protein
MVQPVERATDDRAVDEMAETRMERAWLMTEGAFDPGYFGSTLPQARGEVSSVDVGRIIPPFLGISTTLLVVWIVGDWGDPALAALVGGLAATISIMASQAANRFRGVSTIEELRRARHMATYDRLTGLLNRQSLMVELDDAINAARRTDTVVGVLFLDLDRFKAVNDSMGHEAGDELLKAVARRLKSSLRAADIVGRFGGDEFVVICRGLLEPHSVHRVAEAVLESFRVPLVIGNAEHVATPSIGISTAAVEDDRTAVEMLRDADTAMYEAKRARTGLSVFDERSREFLIERLQVESQLRPAMTNNQFAVYYQPIVDVKLERVVSYEALVRWNHPEHGLLGPDRFLDVVEESGLMARLGEVVLRESLAQKSLWTHMEPGANHLGIGVNVAERQLVDPRFPEQIQEALEWADVRPEELILEITEDLMIEHLDSSLSVLRSLGDIGVSLVIDDFGTGRSSLSYVKRLDMIDAIKIDRSFVTGIPNGKVDLAIIEAIVSMAEALELDIVAEGVETSAQARTLSQMGIYRMQGFLFDRPAPAEGLDIKSSLTELPGLADLNSHYG